ncbi:MAG: hypothetical protein R3274_05340, partial [Desulfobacterales bacterium]|nr:hypothetical protein [Desulfobacterales bacterium]
GSGQPKREFLHVDDLAAACLYLINLTADAYTAVCGPLGKQPSGAAVTRQPNLSHKQPADEARVSHINVGSGNDIVIAELAQTIQKVVGYEGAVRWDTTKPDGTPRKLLDISRLTQLGWAPRISLQEGIKRTYNWYLAQSELD